MALSISPAAAKCPDDNVTFGGSLAAAPANAEDNDTFFVTDTGDATGNVTEMYKWDIETGQWIAIPLDTDVSAINAALAGTTLTVSITEDGVTLLDTVDLSSLLDDTDVSAVSATVSGNDLTIGVTEDGVTVTDTVTLPDTDTDVSAVAISDGPNSTPAAPTIQFEVTEDGTTVVSNEYALPICPDEMTRAALIALRNSGSLLKDCHYVVTNPNANGTLQLQKVLIHALDASTLSGCYLLTAHDNTAWNGSYDIDVDRVIRVHDHLRNNLVTGHNSVTTFPFGVGAAYNNTVHNTPMVYVSGNFQNNEVNSAQQLRVEGGITWSKIGMASNVNQTGGTIAVTTVDNDSDLTVSGGTVENQTIIGDSAAIVSGGRLRHGTISGESRVTVVSGNADHNTVSDASTLTQNGGNFRQSTVTSGSTVTINAGDNYQNAVSNSSSLNQVGTGYIRRTTIANESNVTQGNTNMNDNVFERTGANFTGSAGAINYNEFQRATINATNVASLTLDSNSFSANSQMTVTGAARTYVRYTTMAGYGRILQSAGTSLDANYTGLRDYAYVQVLNGTLFCNYTSVSSVSYVQHNTPNTNYVDSCVVENRSRIRFLGTCTLCRVYYTNVSGGSLVEHRGASSGCYFYNCEVTSASSLFSDGSVNLRAYYNALSGNSEMYSRAVSATHYMYYNHCAGHGYIRFENSTGGRIYAVSCTAQGLLRFRGANAAGRIYYCSFTAYYYLYADNWTITRTSLHGYGRRTYTITNPAANGTFTQNF